jgi:hypothetical protein
MTCKADRWATNEDYDPVFVMDPAMQLATLQLGPHQVQRRSEPAPPLLTFSGVNCNPDEEDDDMGPNLSRNALAEADLFGGHVRTTANDREYGLVSRGALLSKCAWALDSGSFTVPLEVFPLAQEPRRVDPS